MLWGVTRQARCGVPITIVEQHSKPGGYATSFEREDRKFAFEISLHGTAINNNAPARILDELGVLSKIELAQLPEIFRLKTPELDICVPCPLSPTSSRLRWARSFPR